MSIHRSLRSADTMKRHRSVLSRLERSKILQEKGTLDLQVSSILGLPKVKHLKIRVRKEKAAATEATAAGAGTPGTPAPSQSEAAKPKK